MRIGELARQVGLATSAIRFYEASGLLPEATRGANGYREYGADALERLRWIQLAQRLGFTLDALREVFAHDRGEGRREQVMARLTQRREEIAKLRAELDAQDAALERLAKEAQESWGRGDCVYEAQAKAEVAAVEKERRRKRS